MACVEVLMIVIPAKAGIQGLSGVSNKTLGSRLRGNDEQQRNGERSFKA
jgi:hypothetical protein